jgi:Spy/CpxP family protein refolding chaperone
MTRRITTMTLILMFVAVAVFAQGRGGMTPPAPGMARGGQPGGGQQALVEFLGLSTAQQEQWKAIHEQFRTSQEALVEQAKAVREQIKTQLEAATPNATAIGTLVIQQYGIREQIRAAHDALQTQLKAILTAEQLVKFEAWQAARGPGMGRGPGHGPGGGPAGGPPCGSAD